jgi:hypothetical protein
MAKGSDFLQKFINDLEAILRVGHFASAEFEGDFHLHILAEKVNGVLNFDAEIVRIYLGAELNFFDLIGVLMLLGFLVPLGLFVTVFAEVDHATDGRGGIGRNFDQVNACGPSQVQSVAKRQYAELFAVAPDYPDFAGADLPVYSDEWTGRRRRT